MQAAIPVYKLTSNMSNSLDRAEVLSPRCERNGSSTSQLILAGHWRSIWGWSTFGFDGRFSFGK